MRMRESKSPLDMCQLTRVCSSCCGPVYLRNSDCNQCIEAVYNYCMDAKIVHRVFSENFACGQGSFLCTRKYFAVFLSIRIRKVRVVYIERARAKRRYSWSYWSLLTGEDGRRQEEHWRQFGDRTDDIFATRLRSNLRVSSVVWKRASPNSRHSKGPRRLLCLWYILQNTSNMSVVLGILTRYGMFPNRAHQKNFCDDPVPTFMYGAYTNLVSAVQLAMQAKRGYQPAKIEKFEPSFIKLILHTFLRA